MSRLAHAGFKQQFVAAALLPDWWNEACAEDPNMLPEFELRIARFFDAPLTAIRSGDTPLVPPSYSGVQLRQVRKNMRQSRLRPAIHTALKVSQAVIRNLRHSTPATIPPSDANEWRMYLQSNVGDGPIRLENALDDLWMRGIPVIPVEHLPSPSFQALACLVEDRPAIVLGQKFDEPGRVAFLIAHEAGHLASGDCSPESPVVLDALDAEDAVSDDSVVERRADRFAIDLLGGKMAASISGHEGFDAKGLAQSAFELEINTDADASFLIYAWAQKTQDYATARGAVEALYRANGARHQVRAVFDKFVDIESAGESDRNLLRCVYGETSAEAAG